MKPRHMLAHKRNLMVYLKRDASTLGHSHRDHVENFARRPVAPWWRSLASCRLRRAFTGQRLATVLCLPLLYLLSSGTWIQGALLPLTTPAVFSSRLPPLLLRHLGRQGIQGSELGVLLPPADPILFQQRIPVFSVLYLSTLTKNVCIFLGIPGSPNASHGLQFFFCPIDPWPGHHATCSAKPGLSPGRTLPPPPPSTPPPPG